MSQNQQPRPLQDIRHALNVAISQLAIYNSCFDAQNPDDRDFSTCLISLRDDLDTIATDLYQYEQSQAIAPLVVFEGNDNGK